MADTHITITGNLTDDPDLRFTPQRQPGGQLPSGRDRPRQGRRGLARRRDLVLPRERLAAAGRARRRVPHQGRPGGGDRPAQVPQLGDPEGDKRSVVEVEADEVAPSLRWGTAKPERVANGSTKGKGGAEFGDDAPF